MKTQGKYTRGKSAFVRQALREKSSGLDPQLGQVSEDFAGHCVATLEAQASLQ